MAANPAVNLFITPQNPLGLHIDVPVVGTDINGTAPPNLNAALHAKYIHKEHEHWVMHRFYARHILRQTTANIRTAYTYYNTNGPRSFGPPGRQRDFHNEHSMCDARCGLKKELKAMQAGCVVNGSWGGTWTPNALLA